MRCTSLLKRKIVTALFILPSLLEGCSARPQGEHEVRSPAFVKIRFDSTVSLPYAPPASLDTAKSLLKDVFEVGGRVVSVSRDTVVIALSYALLADRRYPGEGRTIRRGGSHVLPELVFVSVQQGVRIEPWNPRESNRLTSTILPIVFLLGVLLSLRYGHW